MNISDKILEMLRCCDCEGKLILKSNNFVCLNCARFYPIHDDIPDLTIGEKSALRRPKIYNDPDYKKWLESLAKSQDYFYKNNGLITYVQNEGHRAVRKLSKIKNYEIVLDLGCGDGAHYPYLKKNANYIFGIDIDRPSLQKLKVKYPDFQVLRADAYNLPVNDLSVDCIINIYNLEHLVFLDFALEEMCRVLKPDGDVFVSVPNEGGWAWVLGRMMTTMKKFSTSSLNYKRANEIDHINCIWQLEKAILRYFKIADKINFPLIVPSFNFNLITTYRCIKR